MVGADESQSMRRMSASSYIRIGNVMHRDHSTVCHGAHIIEALLARNPALRAKVDRCIEMLHDPVYEQTPRGDWMAA